MPKYKNEIDSLFFSYIVPLLQIKKEDYKIVLRESPKSTDEDNKLVFTAIYEPEKINYKIITRLSKSDIGKIVQKIWQELFDIFVFIIKNNKLNEIQYKDSLYENSFVWGIAQWLSGGDRNTDKTIYSIIRQFMNWSMKTYEGNRVRFGVVIDQSGYYKNNYSTSKINFYNFLHNDSAASISDGADTYFVVSSKGIITEISDAEVSIGDKQALSPYELHKVCNSTWGKNVGICLSSSGDIYCFKKQQLRIARINGKWVCFSYEAFSDSIKKIAPKDCLSDDMIKSIYNTCLDVSFARTGGCLAICNYENSKKEKLEKILPSLDDSLKKFPLISSIHNSTFLEFPRLIRKEFCGIDGAMIMDYWGKIIRIGAIINSVKPGSDGGGRKAATIKLSEFGIAIKISADGYIQILNQGKTIKEFK